MTAYKPFIFKLPAVDVSDIYKDTNVIISSNIAQPLFSLGFHSFIHRTKSAMSITKKLETKNKFYYIVNSFEHNINDYDMDIAHVSDVFLNKPNILSRAFYKMWEILYIFDLANKDKMIMTGLAEGPGSFIQAFVEFREQYYDPSNDTVIGLTIQTNNNMNINMNMVDNMNERYNNMITVMKTSNAKNSKGTKSTDISGDIRKISTIKYLQDKTKQKSDFITADGGFEWIDENYQEQEAYGLILGEIICAISTQAKDGSFVLKVFETFTHTTIKLIYLIASFYEETYIYKPFFSRNTNSEKYIICKGFKYNSTDEALNKKIKLLEDALVKCDTDKFINDMFPKFKLQSDNSNMLHIFKYINICIANTQQVMINRIVVYVKSNNYFGDLYHSYREQQIRANKWWLDNFFTNEKSEKKTLIKETIDYNESELNLFIKKLL